ncbi:MAG TPA: LLM class flavin-dependent oxidoreductase [Actinomycetota bacterium]|nr:LLM class flavin-dependent oxidoreductase [Actinomycetota bacterium]
MRFGLFYEHNLPRPWQQGDEQRLFTEILDQVELADRLGYGYVWQVEHHFLEEYSHSSAPEVLLGAYSQRTRDIRLGHGIIQTPPQYNHPARVAERVATLDLVSGGRVEFGTGESSSVAELGGFGLDRSDKREAWREGTRAAVRLMVEEPFTGIDGRFVKMPPRNCVPKPVQKPHPPLWLACSQRETIHLAAQSGMGALAFAFVSVSEAEQWVSDYYRTIAKECVPIGEAINPSVAIVTPLMCCPSEEEAKAKGEQGAHFFAYALAWYYAFGSHAPGRSEIWKRYLETGDAFVSFREQMMGQAPDAIRGCIGTPDQIREVLRAYEEAGVDQVIFFSQCGHNRHEDICESYDLLAREVLPEFMDRDAAAEPDRARRVAAWNADALERRSLAEPEPDPDYTIDAPMVQGATGAGLF